MKTNQNNKATHPGERLKNELEERNIRLEDFFKQIGMPQQELKEFMRGKREVTVELAEALAGQFGIPATTWLKMQEEYNQVVAERNAAVTLLLLNV